MDLFKLCQEKDKSMSVSGVERYTFLKEFIRESNKEDVAIVQKMMEFYINHRDSQ